MGYVLTKGTDKPIRDTEVQKRTSDNRNVVVGAKARTEEEEKKLVDDLKKSEKAWEEKRKAQAVKAKAKVGSESGINEADAKKLAGADDLEKENSELKSTISSFESEQRVKLEEFDKTIEELKAENAKLKDEALKQGGSNSGKNKPSKSNK